MCVLFTKWCPTLCDSMDWGPFRLLLLYNTGLFSGSVVSNSLQPHELQHARLPCTSPSPGACSNSCPLSRWCHPTVSSSVFPFSSCLQSFPASESLPNSQLFSSGGQRIGASASASISPTNEVQQCLSVYKETPCRVAYVYKYSCSSWSYESWAVDIP